MALPLPPRHTLLPGKVFQFSGNWGQISLPLRNFIDLVFDFSGAGLMGSDLLMFSNTLYSLTPLYGLLQVQNIVSGHIADTQKFDTLHRKCSSLWAVKPSINPGSIFIIVVVHLYLNTGNHKTNNDGNV